MASLSLWSQTVALKYSPRCDLPVIGSDLAVTCKCFFTSQNQIVIHNQIQKAQKTTRRKTRRNHERTKEAVAAGLKYLFYSVAGAFLALFGIFLLLQICGNQTFTPGGVLTGMLGAGA